MSCEHCTNGYRQFGSGPRLRCTWCVPTVVVAAVSPITVLKPTQQPDLRTKYGAGEPGEILRFQHNRWTWKKRDYANGANTWVRLPDGQAGVIYWPPTEIGETLNLIIDDAFCASKYEGTAMVIGPFDPNRPDLDPAEAANGIGR